MMEPVALAQLFIIMALAIAAGTLMRGTED
jgi:hypothetical protein